MHKKIGKMVISIVLCEILRNVAETAIKKGIDAVKAKKEERKKNKEVTL